MKGNKLVVQVTYYESSESGTVITESPLTGMGSTNLKFTIPTVRTSHRNYFLTERQRKDIDAVFERINEAVSGVLNDPPSN